MIRPLNSRRALLGAKEQRVSRTNYITFAGLEKGKRKWYPQITPITQMKESKNR